MEKDNVQDDPCYKSAKVIILRDTGVGKSGLGLALTGHSYMPTDSTHAHSVWTFSSQQINPLPGGQGERREILLWDMAGQPGYRLINQQYLNEVTVALIVFDACSETDPFVGVEYWVHALRQAEHIQGDIAPTMKKFLVAARIDRGGIAISDERIQLVARSLGFDDYFETSAKTRRGIAELTEAIRAAVDWGTLPCVRSTRMFLDVKAFILAEKKVGSILLPMQELYERFLKFLESRGSIPSTEVLRTEFEIGLDLIESQGLLQLLSFESLVLLQPELLDIYISALIEAVREEPDGLGGIEEERVLAGDFHLPYDRLEDKGQEKLLLIDSADRRPHTA